MLVRVGTPRDLHTRSLEKTEVGTAVALPTGLNCVGALRHFVAVADGFEARYGEAEAFEELGGAARALVAKRKVVGRRSTLIAMAFDGYLHLREICEQGAEQSGVVLESGGGAFAEIGAVVVEVDVLEEAGDFGEESG